MCLERRRRDSRLKILYLSVEGAPYHALDKLYILTSVPPDKQPDIKDMVFGKG
jgi:hypothetical protein